MQVHLKLIAVAVILVASREADSSLDQYRCSKSEGSLLRSVTHCINQPSYYHNKLLYCIQPSIESELPWTPGCTQPPGIPVGYSPLLGAPKTFSGKSSDITAELDKYPKPLSSTNENDKDSVAEGTA